MAGLRLAAGEIPPKAMKYILHGLCTIGYGEMVLVAQDGVLMQVEWNEKRRLDCWHDTEDTDCLYSDSSPRASAKNSACCSTANSCSSSAKAV